MKKKELFFERSTLLLLICLMGAIFTAGNFSSPTTDRLMINLFFTGILLFGIGAVSSYEGKLHKRRLIILAVLVPLYWTSSFFTDTLLEYLVNAIMVLFLFVITCSIIVWLMKKRQVDNEVLIQALNGYLLIGLSGAIVYALIYRFHGVGSFTSNVDGALSYADMIYYSFITLCSIGFGDILPVSPLARSTTLFFGIAGQLYTTFLVAFLIGQFVPKSYHKNEA